MDTTLKDKADQPILTLSQRWKEDPAEILTFAIPTTILGSLVMTAITGFIIAHGTGHLYVGVILACLTVYALLCAGPMLAFANGVRNGAIERARKALAKAEAEDRARRDAELVRLDEVAKTIRLPLLEWAVQSGCPEKIEGLDRVLARAVEQDHILPLKNRYQALNQRIRNSSVSSLADPT